MDEEEEAKIDSINKYNKKALSKSIYNQNEAKEITSIMMNKEQGLIRRRKTHSAKFLHDMKVGIVDKQGKPLSKEDYIILLLFVLCIEINGLEKSFNY